MKKIVSLMLMFLMIVLLFTGCNSYTDKQQTVKLTEGYPVTADNYGRTVTVEYRPQKVLTLGPNCTELFVALGLGDYVVGRSLVNHSRGPLDEYAEAVNKIPQLNYAEATREAVLTSGADFIYALDWEISDEGVNIDEVGQYGMKVYVNSATTLEEQYKEILDIGKMFKIEETAERFVEDQKARIFTVQRKLNNITPVNVLVYDSGNDGVFTCSGTNFESILIQQAGGKNIFEDIKDKQWITVSYEEVLKRNPDVIVIHDYDKPSVEEKIAEYRGKYNIAVLTFDAKIETFPNYIIGGMMKISDYEQCS